jgi:NADP-dependent aldehyde dehydrogenase
LKESADKAGNPIYLELSSINPIFILPGALTERSDELAGEFSGSCLMGTGQFCTNPGMVVLLADEKSDAFMSAVAEKFSAAPVGTFLSEAVQKSFLSGLAALQEAGAELIAGGEAGGGTGFSCQNTLLKVDGAKFLENPEALQAEAFGNGSLFVIAADAAQAEQIAESLEGNLTGCIYSATDGSDDPVYDQIAPALRTKVGRLLDDKMPTGVAVSPAMNHGGPFPATGHPVFTAVGMPQSIYRYSMLQSYDGIRAHRLPASLRDEAPNETCWRYVDGNWRQGNV